MLGAVRERYGGMMGILKWWCSKFGHGSPVLEPYGIIRCMRCREVLCDLVKALNMKRENGKVVKDEQKIR